MGLSRALADDAEQRLTFGAMEPLVSLMQETPPNELLPQVVSKLKGGVDSKMLVTAAAAQRPLRRPGLHRLPHVHGPGARLSNRR
jgi:hypothetical protein